MTAPREALRPAEAFHPSVFILEELEARCGTLPDLAERMGGDATVNQLALELYLTIGPTDKNILLGQEMAKQLETAFGTSAQFWLNLHECWVKHG